MAEFVPQFTIPATDDPYFIRKEYGGYSPCIKGKPEYFPGSPLANCVAWAWGIAAKREQNPNCNIGFAKGAKWPGNAWDWISRPNGRRTGMTPELGAIACWIRNDGVNSGHVASVEQINEDGSVVCAESGYDGFYFQTKTYRNGMSRANSTFQGFIYLHWPGDPPLPPSGDETDVLYPLAVGDKVRIIGRGAATVDGGAVSYGEGWIRYIQGVYVDGQYPFKVGRLNGGTTGYYKRDALQLIESAKLKIGDSVEILAPGNANSRGTGATSYGIGWKRTIINYLPGRKFPYRVGKDGKTTGYYTADALRKI